MDMTVVMEIVPGAVMPVSPEQGKTAGESRCSSGGFALIFAEAVGGGEEPSEQPAGEGTEIMTDSSLFPLSVILTAGGGLHPPPVTGAAVETVDPFNGGLDRTLPVPEELAQATAVPLTPASLPVPDSLGGSAGFGHLTENGGDTLGDRSGADTVHLDLTAGIHPVSPKGENVTTLSPQHHILNTERGVSDDAKESPTPLTMLVEPSAETHRPAKVDEDPALLKAAIPTLHEGDGVHALRAGRSQIPPDPPVSTGQHNRPGPGERGIGNLHPHHLVRELSLPFAGAEGQKDVTQQLALSEEGLPIGIRPLSLREPVNPYGGDAGEPVGSGFVHRGNGITGDGILAENSLPLMGGGGAHHVSESETVEGSSRERVIDSRSIADQIERHLTLPPRREEPRTVRLQLHPEELGKVQVTISLERQTLEVEIVTESHAVRSAVMEHADQLRENLQRRNITVGSFEVSTRSGEFSQGMLNEQRNTAHPRQRSTLWAGRFDGGSVERVLDAAILPVRNSEYALLDVRF